MIQNSQPRDGAKWLRVMKPAIRHSPAPIKIATRRFRVDRRWVFVSTTTCAIPVGLVFEVRQLYWHARTILAPWGLR